MESICIIGIVFLYQNYVEKQDGVSPDKIC